MGETIQKDMPNDVGPKITEVGIKIIADIHSLGGSKSEEGYIVGAHGLAVGMGVSLRGQPTSLIAVIASSMKQREDVNMIIRAAVKMSDSEISLEEILQADLGLSEE